MNKEDIEKDIKKLESEIESLSQKIESYESLNKQSNDVLERLEDDYHTMIQLINKNILNYTNLSFYKKKSYHNKIFGYKEKALEYDEKYINASEKLRGINKIHYSSYLRLNNKIYELFLQERNRIVHHHPESDTNLPDFLNKNVSQVYKKIHSNLDKAIDNIKTELENLKNTPDDYKQFKDFYEVLGDLFVHKALLRNEKQILLGKIKKKSISKQADEAKKAFKFYNKAVDYGGKLEDAGIRYLTYRADNYLEIFKEFMFKDKLGNLKEITDLKEKRNHIEEKFKIWEKYSQYKFVTNPLRGMKDFYPEDLRKTNWILNIVEDIANRYSYDEFEGPLLEPIEIFAAKSSYELVYEQSFYVEKFEDRKIILRPELTPTLARMVAQKSQELKKPIRWYSVPTCFRYEQPQRGRLRSFKQVNFDILGENSLYAELEIFNISIDILTSFGATEKQFQIYYNNRRFIDVICELILNIPSDKMPLVYKILDKADKMDETEFEKYIIDAFKDEYVIQGILKIRDSNNLKELLSKFDEIPEKFYQSNGYTELINLNNLIKDAGISKFCSFSPSIVRGLDYYTGTVFEVFDTGEENRRAIFGGGRYDDLLSLFSDEQLSGIGFGMGVLMLSLFLKTYDLIPEFIGTKDYSDTIYIASVNEKVAKYSIELANTIREEDFPCIIDYRFKNLKNQLKRAKELGVLITLIIGPKEVEQNCVAFRNMFTEKQETIDLDGLIEEIYNAIENYGDISDDDEDT